MVAVIEAEVAPEGEAKSVDAEEKTVGAAADESKPTAVVVAAVEVEEANSNADVAAAAEDPGTTKQ